MMASAIDGGRTASASRDSAITMRPNAHHWAPSERYQFDGAVKLN
jgi:hypothetical protein